MWLFYRAFQFHLDMVTQLSLYKDTNYYYWLSPPKDRPHIHLSLCKLCCQTNAPRQVESGPRSYCIEFLTWLFPLVVLSSQTAVVGRQHKVAVIRCSHYVIAMASVWCPPYSFQQLPGSWLVDHCRLKLKVLTVCEPTIIGY